MRPRVLDLGDHRQVVPHVQLPTKFAWADRNHAQLRVRSRIAGLELRPSEHASMPPALQHPVVQLEIGVDSGLPVVCEHCLRLCQRLSTDVGRRCQLQDFLEPRVFEREAAPYARVARLAVDIAWHRGDKGTIVAEPYAIEAGRLEIEAKYTSASNEQHEIGRTLINDDRLAECLVSQLGGARSDAKGHPVRPEPPCLLHR